MSRLVVFGLDNQAVGEFSANCNRGWILLGNVGVSGGGATSVAVPDEVALQPWLQLGRLVLVERPPLPAWVGVLDTPWRAAPLPVEITLYNAEYLFALRAAERSVSINGSISDAVKEMIRIANNQEPIFTAVGNTDSNQGQYSRAIEQGNIWDQAIKLLEESGYEMVLRPERNIRHQLNLYADVGARLGIDTGFLLHDGVGKNMTLIDAHVDGKITNRVIAVSGQSTEDDQLQTDALEDQSSQDIYRTRSEVVQFRNVTQLSVLTHNGQTYLDNVSRPYLELTVEAMNIGETFANLRVGNRLLVHASEVYLPGGVRGWRGSVRILAMVYDETQDTVRMTLKGIL